MSRTSWCQLIRLWSNLFFTAPTWSNNVRTKNLTFRDVSSLWINTFNTLFTKFHYHPSTSSTFLRLVSNSNRKALAMSRTWERNPYKSVQSEATNDLSLSSQFNRLSLTGLQLNSSRSKMFLANRTYIKGKFQWVKFRTTWTPGGIKWSLRIL